MATTDTWADGNVAIRTVTAEESEIAATPSGANPVPLTPLQLQTTVTYATSTGALWTCPASEIWYVQVPHIETLIAWDGSGAALDLGIVGGDTDGFIDGAVLTLNGSKGLAADERGALLYDSGNAHSITVKVPGGTSIGVVVTPGSAASTGFSVVRVFGWRVPAL